MEKKLSARDREALSAYLDDELSQRERNRLEKRLERDSELNTALEEMRELRLLLRNLPEVRAPRNFTLTPEMVREKSWLERWLPSFSLTPSLSWASAVATLLLVVTLLGDATGVLTGGTAYRLAQPAPQATPNDVAVEELAEAPVEEMAEAVQEAAPAALPEEPLSEPTPESEPPLMLQVTQEVGEPLEREAAGDLATRPAPSPTLKIDSFDGITVTVEGGATFADESEPLIGGDQRAGQFLTPTESPAETVQSENGALLAQEPTAGLPGISYLRVVEILLALVALTTGLTSLYLRRSRRRI